MHHIYGSNLRISICSAFTYQHARLPGSSNLLLFPLCFEFLNRPYVFPFSHISGSCSIKEFKLYKLFFNSLFCGFKQTADCKERKTISYFRYFQHELPKRFFFINDIYWLHYMCHNLMSETNL